MGIRLEDVTKIYGRGTASEYVALDHISLEIQDGEMIAIKGKSGAGKSTLLHMIGLLDTVSAGRFEMDGTDVLKMKNARMAEVRNLKIGFVLQDFGLIEEETVLYNISLPLMFGKTRLKEIEKTAMKIMEKTGVGHLAEKPVALLSGGEKQRVAIARALVCGPKYILADEPTGALDSSNAENIIQILKKLNAEGKTIVIVTHDDAVAQSCKKIITLSDGQIV